MSRLVSVFLKIYFFVYFFIKTSKTWGIFNYTFLSKIISGNLCLSFLYMLNNMHFPISFYKLGFRKKPHIGLQQLKSRSPASRKAQSVYDEPGKKLDLLFIYFSTNWTFGQKPCIYLPHSALEHFEKLTKNDIKRSYFKKLGRIQSQNWGFLKAH